MKENGYATLCIGKWHVGDQPEFLPMRQGFDHYFGIPYSNDMRITRDGKSGPPLMRDSYCAPVFYRGSVNAVPEPFASAYVPCVHTEEWLYGRGPGNLLATVRLRGGTVQSITYGREPQ